MPQLVSSSATCFSFEFIDQHCVSSFGFMNEMCTGTAGRPCMGRYLIDLLDATNGGFGRVTGCDDETLPLLQSGVCLSKRRACVSCFSGTGGLFYIAGSSFRSPSHDRVSSHENSLRCFVVSRPTGCTYRLSMYRLYINIVRKHNVLFLVCAWMRTSSLSYK